MLAAAGAYSNMDGGPGQSREIKDITRSEGGTIICYAFPLFCAVTGVVVHSIWGIWYFIFGIVLNLGWDKDWNCIYIWKCPFSLVPVWIAIWLMMCSNRAH